VLFVRLVKQSFVSRPLDLHRCATNISSSSLANVAFSLSESENDTPDAAMREPSNTKKHQKNVTVRNVSTAYCMHPLMSGLNLSVCNHANIHNKHTYCFSEFNLNTFFN